MRNPRYVFPLAMLAALACSEATAPENTGAVLITIDVTGPDPDVDGFEVSIDGGAPIVVLPPDSVTTDLQMGHHTVSVVGVAPNCSLIGPDTRSIAVNSSETLEVPIVVSCTAVTGAIEVRAATTGLDRDQDGYGVSLDGGPVQLFASLGVARFTEVSAGSHSVELSGLAANCSPAGINPVDVAVTIGGTVRDTARVVLGVACVAVTGVVEVHIQSSGPDMDLDGFSATLDGGTAHATLPNDVIRFAGASGGMHSVGLAGIAPNCTAAGPMPRPVTVLVGGATRDTARVTIAISCLSTTGVVEIHTTTTGPDQDAGGFAASIDGGGTWAVPTNGYAWLTGVSGGSHLLGLSGIAANCSAAGPNPIPLSITVGTSVQDTVHLAVSVTCTATTGVIRVREVTTGPYHDPSYLVSVDGGPMTPLPSGTVATFPGLLPGSHSVQLADVASTCSVTSSNPAVVTLSISDTVEVVFDVFCTSAPSTGAQLVFATTGASQDSSYHLAVYSDCYYCSTTYFDGPVAANSTVGLTLPPGPYLYVVSDVAGNCTGPSYAGFTVVDQQTTTVSLNYNCSPTGTLRVTVPVSGQDPDQNFYVTIDGNWTFVAGGGSISVMLPVGAHTIGLTDVAANCAVTGPNPTTVSIAQNTTTDLSFPVTCAPNPTLQVTVATTGPNGPAGYLVGVDPSYYYGYTHSASIPVNGGVSLGLPPGQHFVTLDQVPLNCTVTSANNVTVTMTLGMTTNLAFTVVCH